MNKYVKKFLCIGMAAGLIATSFSGCAKINYVFQEGAIRAIHEIKDGSWQKKDGEEGVGDDDPIVIDELKPGTYGGVDFQTLDDVANYYKEAYNYTKSLTAEYVDDQGNTVNFYKLLGDETMELGDVMIDGSANAVVNKLVPGIMSSMFKPTPYGLPPCNNRNPDLDNNSEDVKKVNDHDFRTTDVTGEDILAANVTDNGDGTITLEIQPKGVKMALRGDDAQGRFFQVLGDIGGVVSDIDAVSFTQGTADENVTVFYKGGTAKVKIDTATKEVVEADYTMISNISVTHASIAVIKDKSASLIITYKNHFPASDEFLQTSKGITRK
ncbi:MAG: hypothetical protein IJ851_02580 [Eubacterium sp.]|nr:hypothetical protein [Eubacterium sp.]